ncbi:hypothetical protein HC256_003909 [Beauveria bassiana]|uniref:Uncharacterized protein n=1 Tax=Beauveria bassiana TaxID=176275 RepID=A0A2N6NL65_BEABA|nr:hypothetical protein HC256_003909 [Beauveria bassiana]PMB68018.1 hypothetical protein BM221_006194 [Beauveria bassiana]
MPLSKWKPPFARTSYTGSEDSSVGIALRSVKEQVADPGTRDVLALLSNIGKYQAACHLRACP